MVTPHMMFNNLRDGFRPDYFSGSMWIVMVLKIVWVVAVILFVIWVIKSLIKANKITEAKEVRVIEAHTNVDALRIVKERYAKGEITKEQYDLYLIDLK
jgi:uncharacterized membrane protein